MKLLYRFLLLHHLKIVAETFPYELLASCDDSTLVDIMGRRRRKLMGRTLGLGILLWREILLLEEYELCNIFAIGGKRSVCAVENARNVVVDRLIVTSLIVMYFVSVDHEIINLCLTSLSFGSFNFLFFTVCQGLVFLSDRVYTSYFGV